MLWLVICLRVFASTVPTRSELAFEYGCLVYFKALFFMFFTYHIAQFYKAVSYTGYVENILNQ